MDVKLHQTGLNPMQIIFSECSVSISVKADYLWRTTCILHGHEEKKKNTATEALENLQEEGQSKQCSINTPD